MLDKLKEIDSKESKNMSKEAERTKFTIDEVRVDGGRATLTLNRQLKKTQSKETLFLVLESPGWKLIPNE
jgi:hypothetical protein